VFADSASRIRFYGCCTPPPDNRRENGPYTYLRRLPSVEFCQSDDLCNQTAPNAERVDAVTAMVLGGRMLLRAPGRRGGMMMHESVVLMALISHGFAGTELAEQRRNRDAGRKRRVGCGTRPDHGLRGGHETIRDR
jgi:hypothetical protein